MSATSSNSDLKKNRGLKEKFEACKQTRKPLLGKAGMIFI